MRPSGAKATILKEPWTDGSRVLWPDHTATATEQPGTRGRGGGVRCLVRSPFLSQRQEPEEEDKIWVPGEVIPLLSYIGSACSVEPGCSHSNPMSTLEFRPPHLSQGLADIKPEHLKLDKLTLSLRLQQLQAPCKTGLFKCKFDI